MQNESSTKLHTNSKPRSAVTIAVEEGGCANYRWHGSSYWRRGAQTNMQMGLETMKRQHKTLSIKLGCSHFEVVSRSTWAAWHSSCFWSLVSCFDLSWQTFRCMQPLLHHPDRFNSTIFAESNSQSLDQSTNPCRLVLNRVACSIIAGRLRLRCHRYCRWLRH